jgi:hypothetical protein
VASLVKRTTANGAICGTNPQIDLWGNLLRKTKKQEQSTIAPVFVIDKAHCKRPKGLKGPKGL